MTQYVSMHYNCLLIMLKGSQSTRKRKITGLISWLKSQVIKYYLGKLCLLKMSPLSRYSVLM